MKIRTDFVTNSSSSNYVTINIRNSKLAEIVRAARVCRKNGESDIDDEEYYYDRLDIDESAQLVKLRAEISNLLEYEDKAGLTDIGCPPEHLNDLSKSLIGLLEKVERYPFRNYDFAKICRTLEENSEDVLADTESVDWTYDAQGHGEANLYHWFSALSKYIAEKERLDYRPSSAGLSRSFHYDKENGESHKEECSYSEPYAPRYWNSSEDDIKDFKYFEDEGYQYVIDDWDD